MLLLLCITTFAKMKPHFIREWSSDQASPAWAGLVCFRLFQSSLALNIVSHLHKASLRNSCCTATDWRSWTLKSNYLPCTALAFLIFLIRSQILSVIGIFAPAATENCLAQAQSSWPKDVIFIREGSVIKIVLIAHCLRTLKRSISQDCNQLPGRGWRLVRSTKKQARERQSNTARSRLALIKAWQDYRSCAKYCVMYLFFADPKEEWRYP